MKFALLAFLGFCALSVQASTQLDFDKEFELLALNEVDGLFGVFDKLKDFVDKLVSRVTTTISEIIEKFNKTIAGVIEKIKEVVQKALDKFNTIRKEIEEKLKELQEKNAITRECTAKHAQEIMETMKDSQDKMQTCMTTAEENLQALKEKIQPNIDAIREKTATLAEIFTKCANQDKKIRSVLCVLKNAREVMESITTLIDSTEALIEAARGEGVAIIQETSNCVGVAYDEGQEKLNALMAEVEKCIEEASRPSLLLQ